MWFPNVLRSPSSTPARRRPPASRLRLERLDDRCLPSFIGPVTYPADSIAPGPAAPVQDFNRDGYSDYASLGGVGIIIHLGNGDGTFQTGQSLPISGYFSNGLEAGDFNGDGFLDLVATSTTPTDESNSIDYMDVWLGRSDGTFAVRNTSELGGEPFFRPVVVVDLDGNGRDDVVLRGGYGSLDVWLGQADGTLRMAQNLSNGANGNTTVTVAELNGDGVHDLVVSETYALSVFLGNGDGTLRSRGAYASGGIHPGRPVVADFDRDGRPDIAVFNGGDWYSDPAVGRSLAVLLGNGDGSFQAPQVLISGPDAGLRAVADFNADGFPDVAVTVSGSEVSVLLNDAGWPPPPPPSITISDVTVSEGNSGTRPASFTVSLSKAWGQPVTIAYATANGTATAGSDYQAVSNTLTFAPGETSKTITVLVNGDRFAEPNETLVINLSSPTNTTVADGQGVGTIMDDESRINISDVTKAEGKKNQTTLFTFTVTLSAAYDQAVTMSFRTVDGTAKTGDGDYIARTGTLTFAPGETTKTITIEVTGDSKKEANETFYLDLFGSSGNSLFTKNRGIGTILNDD